MQKKISANLVVSLKCCKQCESQIVIHSYLHLFCNILNYIVSKLRKQGTPPMRRIIVALLCLILFLISCSSKVELQWNQEGGYRWAMLDLLGEETGFRELSASSTGIAFTNLLSEQHIAENQNLLNGSGITAGDVDGDGWVDLYFTSLDGSNKLYKNLGDMEFEDITEEAGLLHEGYHSTGAVFADVDGDDDLDLLITSMSRNNVLYINDGEGNFKLKKDSGLEKGRGSMTMALADIDGDRDLDLYITNYKERRAKDIFDLRELTLENITRRSGDSFEIRPPYDRHFALLQDENGYSQREIGEEDELYINNGDGVFKKVENPEQRFLDANGNPQGLDLDWGLTAKFTDLNDDGYQDLYVCNDYWTPDRVWMNQGDGTFQALGKLAIRNFSFYSMAVDFSDINRDGAVDFFVTEMLAETHAERMRQLVPNDPMYRGRSRDQPQYNRNSLYLNRKDTTFTEITYFGGLEASGWSWAAKFLDIDLDGYEDLIINNGFSYDMQDLDTQNRLSQQIVRGSEVMKEYVLHFPRLELINKAYHNNGNLTFEDKSTDWGFLEPDISHGLATADLDNDGDLDVVVNRLNALSGVFENLTGADRIAVRLKGAKPNTQAIGAKITLSGGTVPQTKQVASGGDYLSGSDQLVVFAANNPENAYELIVNWPSGKTAVIDNIKANRIYEIQESSVKGSDFSSHKPKNSAPTFEDLSDRLNHRHTENSFDEERIQSLLPLKLSRLGPGISWVDYDQDGDEDLFVTASKGERTGIFENRGNGEFRQVILSGLGREVPGDQTVIIGWAEDRKTHLLAGNANYEQGSSGVPSAYHWSLTSGDLSSSSEIPGILSTSGPMAVADYDGDGDLDLFVGGRFQPAGYPQPATSRLFINNEGNFRKDEINSGLLKDIGMVTGAVFTDYDQDGDQDLLLTRSWDSIILLQNDDGKFKEVISEVGLATYKGWWTGISTGDFNNDGLPDLIAANRGLNSAYQLDTSFPLKIFYGDFDNDSRQEIMEAYYDSSKRQYVPRRRLDELAEPVPPVTRFIQSYSQFGNASLEEIFRTDLRDIPSKELNTLQTMLFLNTGDGFRARPLPDEAQFAPVMGVVVADYDNDGNEDVFLSQNLFSLPPLFPRQDAGRGLWLKGDGKGSLVPVPGNDSGIKIYGQQKGAAAADFNLDGKIDLAVGQNNETTKLYRNRTAKPGLNIRLVGPEKNRSAVGSSIRIVYRSGEFGPRRELQAGSGYWSQNGFVQVLGLAEENPKAIEVTWFDDTAALVAISEDRREYVIRYSENGDTLNDE